MAARASTSVTFSVDDTSDIPDSVPGDGVCATANGTCTLRAAIDEINALPNPSIVTILVPPGTYVRTLGAYTINAFRHTSITIMGSGADSTVLDGNNSSNIVINSGDSLTAGGTTIDSVTIQNGSASPFGGGISNSLKNLSQVALLNSVISGNQGGGIFNRGQMLIDKSVVAGNTGSAGGVENMTNLVVRDSTINGNTGDSVGGIDSRNSLTLIDSAITVNVGAGTGGVSAAGAFQMTDTTVDGNTGGGQGGGLLVGAAQISGSTISSNFAQRGGGISVVSTSFSAVNSTITNNSASADGGGVWMFAGSIAYSTITNNSAGSGGGISRGAGPSPTLMGTMVANNMSMDCAGVITDQGFNLDSDATCGLTQSTSHPATDPIVDDLADNGGPTLTRALLGGSPAIDAGGLVANGCPATDQRGVSRPQGPACDIGAFELIQAFASPATRVHGPSVPFVRLPNRGAGHRPSIIVGQPRCAAVTSKRAGVPRCLPNWTSSQSQRFNRSTG